MPQNKPSTSTHWLTDWLTDWFIYCFVCLFFAQTVDKLKIALVKSNISIIAIEGFEELGDVSFQMEKLKVIKLLVINYSF